MPRVTFLLPDGQNKTVDARSGATLMTVARGARVAGITAECGGEAACSTCHVLLHPEWYPKFPEASEGERMMYTFAPGNGKTSRLSCQLKLEDQHDGLVVRVPAEQA